MNSRFLIILLPLIFITVQANAQHDDHGHDHEHPKNEIGFSNNAIFSISENEFAYGIHLHFVRTIGKSDKFGLGIGFEKIFDDHKHNAASLILMYRPIEPLSFNIAPGISWLTTETNSVKPAMHIEGLYEWNFGSFHIGPLIGVAFNTEDFHSSVGIHMAFGF